MATPIGTNDLNTITRRHIFARVVDAIYRSNLLFYRLYRANKKTVRGGIHIEQPILYKRPVAAGNYSGFDLLDTTPTDQKKSAAWDWRQKYVNVTIDGLTMLKNDSPESVANLVNLKWEEARMEMEDRMGTGIYSDAVTDAKEIDGLQGAIDNGTVAATYGGLGSRTTTNDFWQPNTGALDTTTTTLTLNAMQSVFGALTDGARAPTLLVGTQGNYDRFWRLNQVIQRFPTGPSGQDEQLAQAGFRNQLFNNVPFAVDRKVPTVRAGTTGDHLFFLNEDFIELVVHPERDMAMQEFQKPVNQDAATGGIFWMGQLICFSPRLQGLMSAITA